MPLTIEDVETLALAKRLADLTGEPVARAVRRAVEEKLARLSKVRTTGALADALDRIALHCASLPRRDRRSSDAIIGYDDDGVPA